MEKENELAALPKSNPMSGGDGPHSYFRNSSYQKTAIDSTKPKIKKFVLENLYLPNTYFDFNTFKIADYGCSIGPNTFDVIQNILETVKLKYQLQNYLEFQVFFNDQSNNDFNTLFKNRPLYASPKYFVAGAPGSFYDRVLPRNTVNIGHTSYTLHWLSKIPQDVCDRNLSAWNKESIVCSGLVEEVSDAYKAQFKKDMEAFLGARGEELVSGGFLIMTGIYLPDGIPMVRTRMGVAFDMIGDCLVDMANSGILSKEKVESFSLPLYFPYMSELEEVIKQNECFSIEVLERMIHPMEGLPVSNDFIVSSNRAILHGLIEEYFGDRVIDELFDRYAAKLATCSIDFQICEKVMQYFIELKQDVQ